MSTSGPSATAKQQAGHIAYLIRQAQEACRTNIGQISDPKAQALFETVAEVLEGTMRALQHYQQGSEAAWQFTSSTGEGEPRIQHTPEGQRLPPQGPQPPVVTDMAPDISEKFPPSRLYTEVPEE
ncbi:MAG TPA: hypothetical protein VFA41_20235 [Ktedonobacteraceae bacterium]|jgi:hypothetical protein|nr:hypothetical protein [Ktedonobacteraceae bacterium]